MKQIEDQLEDELNENQKLKTLYKNFRNQIYHSDSTDKIDTALGNYLNQFPEREKMKIMFLRESEGIYRFGSKRVYVKTEKGGQMKVRVGGGFMSMGKFI